MEQSLALKIRQEQVRLTNTATSDDPSDIEFYALSEASGPDDMGPEPAVAEKACCVVS